MTQLVAKYAAKKLLSKEMDKYKSKDVTSYDPFYDEIPHPTKPGKTKKVKKQIPAYIPPQEAEILAKARRTAYKLDVCLFNFAGIRFGWSSVIGIVPAAGDAMDCALSLNLIRKMAKVDCGLGQKTLIMMFVYLAIDFLMGLVPFIGDLADAAYKCNSRNVRLLEQRLDQVYKPKELTAEEKRLNRRSAPATVYEDFSDEEDERRPPSYDDHHDAVRQPTRAYSGRRDRVRDEEMGLPRNDTHRSQRDPRDQRPSRNGTKNSRR